MQTVWLVTNPASGSTSTAACGRVEAALAMAGATLAGRTEFPDTSLPTPRMLDDAMVDTLVVFAGDGTINAALGAISGWRGGVLIVPGGTMNLLAKALHGDADPSAIIARAATAHLRALPYVAIGAARAFVAAIIGPAAHWHRPRELVRASRFGAVARSIRLAWQASLDRGIRVTGSAGPMGRHQAVIATPQADMLHIAAVDARRWRDLVRLGWDYATGDWLAAPSVTQWHDREIAVVGQRGILALVDGEPIQLVPPQRIAHGISDAIFLTTLEPAR